jgi:hypothetical protein
MPILNVASLSLKRAGDSAPVRTMVLSGIAASTAAESVIVSVPCVITTRRVRAPRRFLQPLPVLVGQLEAVLAQQLDDPVGMGDVGAVQHLLHDRLADLILLKASK